MNAGMPASSLILGTAGHIDHGKSSLVRALTGTDPDRLAEEKRRGITIELGFAQLKLSSGRTMGVVDVPGHERFVRQMVAGATGIDVALIVVAADDGIMPQTVEHLAVLELLGVRTAVVALTKIDLVDEEWLQLIAEEVREHLARSPFANAPIVGVSSRTGEGLEELRSILDDACTHAVRTKEDGAIRMPIDRVFTVRGFGTVVTGSLWSGSISPGCTVAVLPGNASVRVRSIQTHGVSIDRALAGNRVAVSLVGVSTDDVRPGDFLCDASVARLSDRFDAEFTYFDPFRSGRPFKSGTRVHVAHGTSEVTGRLLLMNGAQTMISKEKALVQIRLDEPLPVAYKDAYIVRSYSPVHVVGGGRVLSSHPRRRTNLKDNERAMLEALDRGDVDMAIKAHLELSALPEPSSTIAGSCGLALSAVENALGTMIDDASLAVLRSKVPLYIKPSLLQSIVASIEKTLLEFHSKNPRATGLAKNELRQMVLPLSTPDAFDAVLGEAIRRDAAVCVEGEVGHPRASAAARMAEQQLAQKVEQILLEAGATPPNLADIADELKTTVPSVCRATTVLLRENKIVRIETDRYYHASAVEKLVGAIRMFIETNGPATASQLKDAMGVTRKYAMPLLEYFDESGLTLRENEVRTLRKQHSVAIRAEGSLLSM